MKWAHSIQQKYKAAVLLAVICAIILGSNLLGRHNMDELGSSFSSVYEDRLLVESYIYQLSEHLYQKKIMLDNCADLADQQLHAKIDSHYSAIGSLVAHYENTLLTPEEDACFLDFKANLAALQRLELQYIQHANDQALSRMNDRFALAAYNLHQLSNIQISEGKLLNDQSQKIVAGTSLLTNLEMVVLICIALAVQVLVLASRPVIPKVQHQGSLN